MDTRGLNHLRIQILLNNDLSCFTSNITLFESFFNKLSRYTVYNTDDNTPTCLTTFPMGSCVDKTSSHLTSIMSQHVSRVCKSANYYLHNQVKLRNRNFVTFSLFSLLWYEIKDVPIYRCKSFKFRTLGVKFRYIYCS